MLRAYKYRISPTKEQESLLAKHFGSCRLVFNLALDVKQQAYISAKKNLSAFDLMKQIPDLKKDCEWLKDVNAQSLQNAVVNLDKAFTAFFKGDANYPTFKNKYSKQSFQCPQGVSIKGNRIFLPKFRDGIKIILDKREISGDIKTVTISKSPTRKYFASVLIENNKAIPVKVKIKQGTSVGIDLGLKSFITTSDGEKFNNPKFLLYSLKRLQMLQNRTSRKKKGSNKRKKAQMKVAILHEKIASQRKDFLHKTSIHIVKSHDTICIEDLNTKGMLANRKLSRSISDVGWGEFVSMLKYKADWYGKNILQIGRFEPSSKICSHCGVKNEILSLNDREWVCVNCSTHHDRDVNAAINIRDFALRNSRRGTPVERPETLRKRKSKKGEYSSAGLPSS